MAHGFRLGSLPIPILAMLVPVPYIYVLVFTKSPSLFTFSGTDDLCDLIYILAEAPDTALIAKN
jgi:hypothetical protein